MYRIGRSNPVNNTVRTEMKKISILFNTQTKRNTQISLECLNTVKHFPLKYHVTIAVLGPKCKSIKCKRKLMTFKRASSFSHTLNQP